jgi:hypothetical protein
MRKQEALYEGRGQRAEGRRQEVEGLLSLKEVRTNLQAVTKTELYHSQTLLITFCPLPSTFCLYLFCLHLRLPEDAEVLAGGRLLLP